AQNRVHLLAIGDTSLQLATRFVLPELDLGLVRQPPFSAVVTQTQQLAFAAQLLARQVIKRVDLVRGWRLFVKPKLAQPLLDRFQIGDEEFDFDFLRCGHEESVNQGSGARGQLSAVGGIADICDYASYKPPAPAHWLYLSRCAANSG